MVKKYFIYCLVVIFLSGATGCNVFSWLHTPEAGAESYIADGKGYLDAGDYDSAVTSFELAKTAEPNNSDALYWYAVGVARQNGISVAELGIDLFRNLASGSMEGDEILTGLKEDKLQTMYDAANKITSSLREIVIGATTSGTITSDDVALSFIINLTLTTIIFLAKIKAAFEQFGFIIDENGNISFENINSVDDLKSVIDTTLGLLDDTNDGYNAISGNEETNNFQDKTDTLYDSIYLYAVADGEDNDGDGEIDEEWLDGIDNDGDGLIDEDSNGLSGP